MYHPGKILAVINSASKEVLSSDTSSQAVLEMWDGNQLTFDVEKKISSKINEGDIVLVDYTQEPKDRLPLPRHLVVKVLKGKTGIKVWNAYKSYNATRRPKPQPSRPTAEKAPKPADHTPRYFG